MRHSESSVLVEFSSSLACKKIDHCCGISFLLNQICNAIIYCAAADDFRTFSCTLSSLCCVYPFDSTTSSRVSLGTVPLF